MKDRFAKIAGVKVDLIRDLDENLDLLTQELIRKQDFQYLLDNAIEKSTDNGFWFDWVRVLIIKIGLLPTFINYHGARQQRFRSREKARILLEEHYKKPETITLRSRLECQINIESYIFEINEIKKEILQLENDLIHAEDDELIKREILSLLKGFQGSLKQKESKLHFYQDCISKISKLEKKMQLLKNIEISKQKFKEIESKPVARENEDAIKNDVVLYEEYGNLLTKISDNISRISDDKEEQIEELELKNIVESIKLND